MESGTPSQIGLVGRLLQRIGNPLRWSEVDKCILVAVGYFLVALNAAAVNGVRLARLDFQTYISEKALRIGVDVFWAMAALSAAFFFIGLALRKKRPHSRVFVYLVILSYCTVTALLSYAMGPFTNPWGVLFLLASGAAGFLLFERAAVIAGLAVFLLFLLATTLAERLGVIPYAPAFRAPPFVEGRLSGAWIMTMGAGALALAILVLALIDYVVRKWREDEALLERLSTTDPLTGVLNRRAFLNRFTEEFDRARRYPRPLACVILDLDHFKRVNDTHGHQMGDQVLVTVATLLQTACRSTDFVARYGGEEFALLLPETDLEHAREMAERCRQRIETELIEGGGASVRASASFGVVALPHPNAQSLDDLIRLADQSLYRAKELGRNRVEAARY